MWRAATTHFQTANMKCQGTISRDSLMATTAFFPKDGIFRLGECRIFHMLRSQGFLHNFIDCVRASEDEVTSLSTVRNAYPLDAVQNNSPMTYTCSYAFVGYGENRSNLHLKNYTCIHLQDNPTSGAYLRVKERKVGSVLGFLLTADITQSILGPFSSHCFYLPYARLCLAALSNLCLDVKQAHSRLLHLAQTESGNFCKYNMTINDVSHQPPTKLYTANAEIMVYRKKYLAEFQFLDKAGRQEVSWKEFYGPMADLCIQLTRVAASTSTNVDYTGQKVSSLQLLINVVTYSACPLVSEYDEDSLNRAAQMSIDEFILGDRVSIDGVYYGNMPHTMLQPNGTLNFVTVNRGFAKRHAAAPGAASMRAQVDLLQEEGYTKNALQFIAGCPSHIQTSPAKRKDFAKRYATVARSTPGHRDSSKTLQEPIPASACTFILGQGLPIQNEYLLSESINMGDAHRFSPKSLFGCAYPMVPTEIMAMSQFKALRGAINLAARTGDSVDGANAAVRTALAQCMQRNFMRKNSNSEIENPIFHPQTFCTRETCLLAMGDRSNDIWDTNRLSCVALTFMVGSITQQLLLPGWDKCALQDFVLDTATRKLLVPRRALDPNLTIIPEEGSPSPDRASSGYARTPSFAPYSRGVSPQYAATSPGYDRASSLPPRDETVQPEDEEMNSEFTLDTGMQDLLLDVMYRASQPSVFDEMN